MNAVDHIQRWVPVFASAVCLLLAGAIWLPLDSEVPAAPAMQSTAGTTADAEATADELASGAQQLLNRPLFHITRRPPAETAITPAAPVQVTLALTGVLNNDDVQIALLRLSNSPELLRRRVGDQVGEWRILSITKTAVIVLSGDGQEQIIGLSSASP
jgi:hypothetical protein